MFLWSQHTVLWMSLRITFLLISQVKVGIFNARVKAACNAGGCFKNNMKSVSYKQTIFWGAAFFVLEEYRALCTVYCKWRKNLRFYSGVFCVHDLLCFGVLWFFVVFAAALLLFCSDISPRGFLNHPQHAGARYGFLHPTAQPEWGRRGHGPPRNKLAKIF